MVGNTEVIPKWRSQRLRPSIDQRQVASVSVLKRAVLQFSLVHKERSQFFSQLYLNRPFVQLSWRTPCRTLVHEMSAAAAHPLAPLRGDPTQARFGRKAKESPAEPADREPSD